MKVVSYSSVVPKKNKSEEKEQLLKKFLIGVRKNKDKTVYHEGYDLVDCDVAVIQGWQHDRGKNLPHLALRKNIIDTQINKGKFVCVADSNLFLYAAKNNQPHHYLRYSFNGVFPNTGIYFDKNIDSKRWQQISKDLNIKLESTKKQGVNILLCLQRYGGWSMGPVDMNSWILKTVAEIRKHSDRRIILRPHPKDNNSHLYLKSLPPMKSIKISQNKSIDEDLTKAWCVVNHNSSSVVAPIIKGYSAFVTDSQKSQCSDVAHHDFKYIESPQEFDREKWLQRVSMFHWKFSELEDGSAWAHIKNYCQ